MDINSIDILQIRPSGLCSYVESFGGNGRNDGVDRTDAQIDNEVNLTRGVFNGYMSDKTKRTVKKRVENWVEAMRVTTENYPASVVGAHDRLRFLTLTLPSKQVHEDNFIKRYLLNWFISILKEEKGLKNYLWRAEAQANGNLHFHILIDVYVDWRDAKKWWNRVLERYGYIEAYKSKHRGMSWGEYLKAYRAPGVKVETLAKRYRFGVATDWRQPNTVDIRKTGAVRDLVNYTVKYMGKTGFGQIADELIQRKMDEVPGGCGLDSKKEIIAVMSKEYPELFRRKVDGRIWGCSDGLKELDYISIPVDSRIEDFLDKLDGRCLQFSEEMFCYYVVSAVDVIGGTFLEGVYLNHYRRCYESLYHSDTFDGRKEKIPVNETSKGLDGSRNRWRLQLSFF